MRGPDTSVGYQFFVLVLSLYAIVIVALQMAVEFDPEIASILDYSDIAVCAVFFVDFVRSLWQAPDRWRYLRTWGWVDLLSSIPVLDAARWGRAARIVRVLRVLRGLRATKILTGTLLRNRAENGVLAALLATIILVTLCSIAMLQAEVANGGNITTAEDAVWWALTTMTTVGYGDRFPVTSEGRMIAAVLMVAGVALFTIFSGFLASWFMQPSTAKADELSHLRDEIAELRRVIERQHDDRSHNRSAVPKREH